MAAAGHPAQGPSTGCAARPRTAASGKRWRFSPPTRPAPDWPQIAALYGALLRFEPTPVVRLNAAVAIAEAGNPMQALAMVEGLKDELSGYQPWHATYAALLAANRRGAEAMRAYRDAIARAPTDAEAHFLARRLERLGLDIAKR